MKTIPLAWPMKATDVFMKLMIRFFCSLMAEFSSVAARTNL